MDNIPTENKLILGTSSLWISTLIYQSYIRELYILSFLLLNIIIASPLYWYTHIVNSYLYTYDSSIVSLYGVILFFYSNYTYNITILLLKIGFILLFYTLSDYYYKRSIYNYQLLCHILFRYIFFIWSYMYINNFKNIEYLLFITMNYFSYNYYLYKVSHKYNLFIYIKHCIQILLLSILYEACNNSSHNIRTIFNI